MVDGVKCFDTDRLGNPIATTGSYPIVGYVPWEARTNLCLQSQTLDNASWTKNNTTVSANAAVAPDGTTTADLIYPTTTGTFRTVLQTVVTSVAVYAYGVYAKAAGKNFIGVYAPNGASLCWFNLSTGVVGTNNTGLTPLITPAGNGWYRCGLIGTNIAVQQFYFGPHDADASNTATTSGTDGIYVWGAQVELGAFAGPYIPTTTVAVARNADVLTYTGAALAALATQGWCYAEVGTAWSVANVGRIIIGATAATVSPLTMYNLDPTAVGYFDGANATAKTGLTSTATGTRKRASTWGGSTVLVTGDGAAPASGAFDGSFSIVELGIGCNTAGANIFSGGIRNVRLGYNKLSDSELRAITS
jgi:hypothetical protein